MGVGPAALIQVRDLVKHFPVRGGLLARRSAGAVRAVDGITFDIGRGETVGLVGESGCGKTTTGRMIMKLIPPTAGEIYFDGRPIAALSPEQEKSYRRQVQMVFQDPFSSLNPRMTVGSIIGYPMRIQNAHTGAARDARSPRWTVRAVWSGSRSGIRLVRQGYKWCAVFCRRQ